MFLHFFSGLQTQYHILLIIKKIALIGQSGVSLFFVLSGFLITRILLNTKQSKSYFSKFYFRRALRIFPLYYLFLIISNLLIPLLQHNSIASFSQQIWYWIYLQNVAITFNWPHFGPPHFWSLAVEEHFYLFWPLITYFSDLKKIKIAIALVIFISLVTKIMMLTNGLSVFYFTVTRMDELAIGALLAVFEIEGRLTYKNLNKFLLLFIASALPAVVLFVKFGGKGLDIVQFIKFTLMAVACFSIIASLIVINQRHWLKKAFQLKPLTYTGKISYGLYVYHPLCYYIVGQYFKFGSIIGSFILCFFCSYAVASLSYYLFESRFLILKRKFSYNE